MGIPNPAGVRCRFPLALLFPPPSSCPPSKGAPRRTSPPSFSSGAGHSRPWHGLLLPQHHGHLLRWLGRRRACSGQEQLNLGLHLPLKVGCPPLQKRGREADEDGRRSWRVGPRWRLAGRHLLGGFWRGRSPLPLPPCPPRHPPRDSHRRGCLGGLLRPPFTAAPGIFVPGVLTNNLGDCPAQHVPADSGVVADAHRHIGSQSLFDYLSRKGGEQGQGGRGRTEPETA